MEEDGKIIHFDVNAMILLQIPFQPKTPIYFFELISSPCLHWIKKKFSNEIFKNWNEKKTFSFCLKSESINEVPDKAFVCKIDMKQLEVNNLTPMKRQKWVVRAYIWEGSHHTLSKLQQFHIEIIKKLKQDNKKGHDL